MENETIYTVWISDGTEVDNPGHYTVFGAIDEDGRIDGNIHHGETYQLDTESQLIVERVLADEIAKAKAALSAIAGTDLAWVEITDNYDDGHGWNVCEAHK